VEPERPPTPLTPRWTRALEAVIVAVVEPTTAETPMPPETERVEVETLAVEMAELANNLYEDTHELDDQETAREA
jgi:hypothetical protein